MAKPPPAKNILSPAFVETIEEIMRLYRSLPPRPSVEEVEAAMSVIQTADFDSDLKLESLEKFERTQDVPVELLNLLKEAKRNMVFLQCYEQKKEAVHVIEMENRLRVFDDLIQRASRLASGDWEEEERREAERGRSGVLGSGVVVEGMERKVGRLGRVEDFVIGNGNLNRKVEEKKSIGRNELSGFKELGRSSSLKSSSLQISSFQVSGGGSEKLNLIKVAGLIEKTAKSGARVLDLQGKLTDDVEWLPVSLGKLSEVTELNISDNRIMELPSTIVNLKLLAKLDVHSNRLTNLPDSFGELTSLVELDLHCNRLKSLPASIGNLSLLTRLDLSSNLLSTLPETLGNLTCLKELIVETNELEELPYTIGSCSSLVEIILDFNQLRALPEAIGKLESLEILTAHYNRIKSLPTTMASLNKLKELDVSFNEVESIPESLCFVTSLVKLNVGNNFADLTSLPRAIGNLEMLEELNISNNQIRMLPESFRLLSKLRVLYTDETPLEVPPREITKLGAQAVVQYMAKLVEPKEQVSQSTAVRKGFFPKLCSRLQHRGNQQSGGRRSNAT